MAYVAVPGFWIENHPSTHGQLTGVGASLVLDTTALVMDAANEAVQLIGKLSITGRATSVAFDTNSKIIFRSGGANTFAEATSVMTIGIQDLDLATGPPGRGDGTYDVFGVIPSVTYADIANATTYAVPMTTGTKTLSHGSEIVIKLELTTFTAADTVKIQGRLNNASILGPRHTAQSSLNSAASTTSPCPLILDFEGDGSVLGIIDQGYPQIETVGSSVTFASGVEHGMLFRPAVNMKIDGFWIFGSLTDAVDGELVLYTDPLGTPAATVLATIDGDTTLGTNFMRPMHCMFAPTEVLAGTDYALVLKSGGTNAQITPIAFNSINHIAHFAGFGVTDKRCNRSGGAGAFSTTAGEQIPWGVHVSHIHDGAGGAGGMLYIPDMAGT